MMLAQGQAFLNVAGHFDIPPVDAYHCGTMGICTHVCQSLDWASLRAGIPSYSLHIFSAQQRTWQIVSVE